MGRKGILNSIFVIVALIIISDFIYPGTIIQDTLIKIKKERQEYYNAAKNHHYSYKAITSKHAFFVSEDFAKSEFGDKKIEYSVSRVFQEVNWYKSVTDKQRSFYSLRILTGLILPILVILFIAISYLFNLSNEIIISILQLLLFADLIFLAF